ncbi:unnamed protein product [Ceratitis capitata]|uniref:(Mediterranean fruit fly) hypothetical protein n=1 Tax=Ceratitis capitata TaxID=7213 RepID=A0A811U825_CERCA|nr:unnamed protein product [Ceratitis capitata]
MLIAFKSKNKALSEYPGSYSERAQEIGKTIARQNTILIEFMEKYPDIAKGFTKRDKPSVDTLSQQLTDSLNGAGPPRKDVNAWKKKVGDK